MHAHACMHAPRLLLETASMITPQKFLNAQYSTRVLFDLVQFGQAHIKSNKYTSISHICLAVSLRSLNHRLSVFPFIACFVPILPF